MQNQINDYQKVCGKYSCRIYYVIKTEIILYLNKLIYGLLKAGYLFYWNSPKFAQIRWNSPPNLLAFKIGDLLRCKFSSKQREILAVYHEIYKIHKNSPEKLKIIKIKNRLKTHTNDILIIVQFQNCFNCEIQLAIKSEVSNFIKCSNKFNHYLYVLNRSLLGPLAQICNVWMCQDQEYLRTFKKLAKKSKHQKKRQCLHSLEEASTLNKCFICNHCEKVYLHNNYVLQHKQSKICQYKRCAECLLQLYDFQRLKKILFKRQNIKDYCLRLVNKKQPWNWSQVLLFSSSIQSLKLIFILKTLFFKFFLADLILITFNHSFEVSMFFDQFLILTPALSGGPRGYEFCHLFEDFIRSKCVK